MPYIDKASRTLLDPAIGSVADKIATLRTERPGDMNYSISKLIAMVYGTDMRYCDYNEVIGVLEDAKLEFYRKRVAKYEDKKCNENGDLY